MGVGGLVARGAAAAIVAGVGYGAATWLRYGRSARASSHDALLDRFMPTYEAADRHQTLVAAPADLTWAAAREVELYRSPLVRAIFRGRELLMGSTGTRDRMGRRSVLDEVLALGWRVLAETPGREIVVGAATQPWQADVVFRGIEPDDFAGFDEPGYAKIGWILGVTPLAPGACELRTETRVATTDPVARARFRRYWAVVSPGILLIRRELLRLVKREAERRSRLTA